MIVCLYGTFDWKNSCFISEQGCIPVKCTFKKWFEYVLGLWLVSIEVKNGGYSITSIHKVKFQTAIIPKNR